MPCAQGGEEHGTEHHVFAREHPTRARRSDRHPRRGQATALPAADSESDGAAGSEHQPEQRLRLDHPPPQAPSHRLPAVCAVHAAAVLPRMPHWHASGRGMMVVRTRQRARMPLALRPRPRAGRAARLHHVCARECGERRPGLREYRSCGLELRPGDPGRGRPPGHGHGSQSAQFPRTWRVTGVTPAVHPS